MSLRNTIELLADGEFHSGEELGEQLGVSRAAVWKQLQKLTEFGLDVHTVRGKGYRLMGGIELLSEPLIRREMSPIALEYLTQLELFDVIASTNDIMLDHAKKGVASGAVCLAEQQTAGRGRRGRNWASPYGRNIYLSCLWHFYQGAATLEGLSLAVGVAVAKALKASGVPAVQLKWPNDVLIGGAKVAGVLLEMTGDASGHCQVVVGIGVNLAMSAQAAAFIDQAWTDVSSSGGQVARNQFVALLLNDLLPMLANFQQRGFEPIKAEWEALDAFRDQPVKLTTAATVIEGIARGLDISGGLLLETTEGVRVLKGGELSLRGVPHAAD